MNFTDCTIAGLGPLRLPIVRCDRPQRPWWEAARLHCMHHYLGDGDRLIDVGTEMGDLSALYASWGCELFLIEANPQAWPWIAATFDANDLSDHVAHWWAGLVGNQTHEQTSVLDHRHTNFITALGSDPWPVSARLSPNEATGFYHLAEYMPVSPVATIDSLMMATGFEPTAITIDIEGGEFDALVGAKATIARFRPKIWVSIHPEFMADMYGHTKDNLLSLMQIIDYDPVFLATDHEEHWMFLPKEYGWRY